MNVQYSFCKKQSSSFKLYDTSLKGILVVGQPPTHKYFAQHSVQPDILLTDGA